MSILFFSALLSIPCFIFSLLFIHVIFWSPLLFSFQICYPFFSHFLFSLIFFILTPSPPSFSHLFLLNDNNYYFLCSLFCWYSFTTSVHWLRVLSLILYTVSAVWQCSTCSVVCSVWLHMGHFMSSSSLGEFFFSSHICSLISMSFTRSLSHVAIYSFLSHFKAG